LPAVSYARRRLLNYFLLEEVVVAGQPLADAVVAFSLEEAMERMVPRDSLQNQTAIAASSRP